MNRTLATLPLSVGTGLAIEALVQTPLFKYTSFLINVKTIIRNAYDAFEKEEGEVLTNDMIFEACKEDIIGIAQVIIKQNLKTRLNMIFYYPSYNGLEAMFPFAKIKNLAIGTQKQQHYYRMEKEVGKRLTDFFSDVIVKNNVLLPSFEGDAIVITHHPVDLATSNSYTRLNLLESHTGTLKRYSEFYTKLTNGKNLFNIPLNKISIQIFGDEGTDFYSMKTTIKNEIKKLAQDAKWTSASTPSFVYRTIRSLPPSPDKEVLLKLI